MATDSRKGEFSFRSRDRTQAWIVSPTFPESGFSFLKWKRNWPHSELMFTFSGYVDNKEDTVPFLWKTELPHFKITFCEFFFFQAGGVICETGDCGQQEFRDQSGSCVLCTQCGPGMELSKVTVGCVRRLYACVFLFTFICLFAWLPQVLVVACGIFCCSVKTL